MTAMVQDVLGSSNSECLLCAARTTYQTSAKIGKNRVIKVESVQAVEFEMHASRHA